MLIIVYLWNVLVEDFEMTGRKIVCSALLLLGGGGAFAVDVDISIDGAGATRYLLQSMQVGASGGMVVNVATVGGTTGPVSYSLTISATNGGIFLNDGAPSPYTVPSGTFTCSSGACSSVSLRAIPDAGYKLKSWGGACSGTATTSPCSVPMTSNQIVSAIFEAESTTPPTGVACNPAGSTLIDVATPLPDKQFSRTDYSSTMTPTTIYSFAFKTKDTTAVVTGGLTAAQLSNSISNKWIVVSECRGDIDRANKDAGCAVYSSESATVTYVLNKGAYRPTLYCNLKPNTQYYANVVAPGKITGLAQDACTTTANCGFSFLAQ